MSEDQSNNLVKAYKRLAELYKASLKIERELRGRDNSHRTVRTQGVDVWNSHRTILTQGVDVWNQWREENPKIQPSLVNADLRELDLRKANLHHAMLHGANLKKANLEGANLRYASLGGANLEEANLTGVDLDNSYLSDANLRGAILTKSRLSSSMLSKTDLTGAILDDANLLGAVLHDSNLAGASLKRANMAGTDLYGVNFGDAQLEGVKLSHAKIKSAIFTGNNFSTIKGLDSVEHSGPSSIGLDTLKNSGGNIPFRFLAGCGLADWEMVATQLYSPGLTASEVTDLLYAVNELRTDPFIQYYSCFISYSHEEKDKAFATRLHDALQSSGIRCWLDERQLLPGHDIFEEVDRGIRLWDKVLLCCSKSSLSSWWVDAEITKAFDKEQVLMRQRGEKVLVLIPLDLDGHLFSTEWESGKASQIKSRLAADFTGWEADNRKFEEQFERLVKALRADADGREAPPKARL